MNMNFQMAFDKLGVAPEKRACIFRYDDTNPAKESDEYINRSGPPSVNIRPLCCVSVSVRVCVCVLCVCLI